MQHDDWNLDTSNYRCTECGDVFNTEAAIEAHIKKTHAPDNPFQCAQCGKVYKDNWHLNRHLQSHSAPPSNVGQKGQYHYAGRVACACTCAVHRTPHSVRVE